ncbi:MAG: lipase family protein [Galactobacter sp.]
MAPRPVHWPTGGERLRNWYGRLPAWIRAIFGVATTVLGVVLLIRPTTSLGVLALVVGSACLVQAAVEVLDVTGITGRRRLRLVALVWLVLGVFVLVWPGLTVRLLAVAVGMGLLINGISDIAEAWNSRGPLDARIATTLVGVATVGFGVISLFWPDITMVIVAVAFGARLISTGIMQLWRIVRRRPRPAAVEGAADAAEQEPASSLTRRWFRTIGALLAVALAVGAGALSLSLHPLSEVTDPFYAAPRNVPDEPGQLIRADEFTRGVPDTGVGYRILYTTTQADGTPAVASGLVVVPREEEGTEDGSVEGTSAAVEGADGAEDSGTAVDHADAGWPVITWMHGTTGVARQCAPSLLHEPFESGGLYILQRVLEHGWALVATDYLGLGAEGEHPYLIGRPSAHASLDAVRAARQLDEAHLGEQTVAWGHSQGGGAALWTGALAQEYAPDVPLSGVAALAPATNLPNLASGLDKVPGGDVLSSYAMAAYASYYSDVTWKNYVRPGAQVMVREMSRRCVSDPALVASMLIRMVQIADPKVLERDPATGAFGRRLEQNIPPVHIPEPVFLAQGTADTLIKPSGQRAFVKNVCRAGTTLDYRTYKGRGHVGIARASSKAIPDLLDWTADRFEGAPAKSTC